MNDFIFLLYLMNFSYKKKQQSKDNFTNEKKYVKANSYKQDKKINEIQKLRWDQQREGEGTS